MAGNTDRRKQSLYFAEEMLQEIGQEAERQDGRCRGWSSRRGASRASASGRCRASTTAGRRARSKAAATWEAAPWQKRQPGTPPSLGRERSPAGERRGGRFLTGWPA